MTTRPTEAEDPGFCWDVYIHDRHRGVVIGRDEDDALDVAVTRYGLLAGPIRVVSRMDEPTQ